MSGRTASIRVVGTIFPENADARDAGQRGDHLGALVFGVDWTRRAFQPPHGCVAVDADQKRIAERACLLQVAHMPNVENVEDAVREDDALAGRAQRFGEGGKFGEGHG